MRVLFNCNTYYQLIVAIQLRLTDYRQDQAVLCFSDLSKDAEVIVNRIKSLGLFTETYLIRKYDKIRAPKTLWDRVKELKRMIFGTSEHDYGEVDVLLYYNLDEIYVYELFATLKRKNKKIRCKSFEENYFSYNIIQDIPFVSVRLTNRIRSLMGLNTLEGRTDTFYCFKPKGLLRKIKADQILPFDHNIEEVRKILKDVFDISPSQLRYNPKYIYFTSVYDFEGEEPVGEYELVCKVADLVGKENMLIKTHPRDMRDVYEKNGFSVDTNSSIPWEAIQINGDFSNNVFLTLNSGSVLLVTTNFENSPAVGYLYNCVNMNKNTMAKKSKDSADSLFDVMKNEKGFDKIHILKSIEDILML